MKKQRLDNINDAIIGQLNVNSFRNKFVFVGDIINLFDVLLVSESKLGHTFKNKNFNFFFLNYDKVTLTGDFYLSSNDVPLERFLQLYNLTGLIKGATCSQSSNMYKLSNTFETVLSNHQKSISIVAKSESFKGRPLKKNYRSYISFNNETF